MYEDAARLVEEAGSIAVVPCVAASQKLCESPSRYAFSSTRRRVHAERGTGRRIDRSEALALLKKAEEVGLVHMVETERDGKRHMQLLSLLLRDAALCLERENGGVLPPSRFSRGLMRSRYIVR